MKSIDTNREQPMASATVSAYETAYSLFSPQMDYSQFISTYLF